MIACTTVGFEIKIIMGQTFNSDVGNILEIQASDWMTV